MAPQKNGHPAESLPAAVNNQGLFSDYYLTELVRENEFFRSSAKDAQLAWLAIKSVYERVKSQLPTSNEPQTEQLFIRPLLDALGYKDTYAVQPDVPSPEGHRRPDYAFFAGPEDLAAAEGTAKGTVEYFTQALAIGDAKAWDRFLDRRQKGAGDAFTNANPSYQIDFYLRATNKTWGILTNGRRWRLYHRDSSYRMNVFYEVDLVALLEEYSEEFLYFFAFFRKEALVTGFLDRVLTGSRDYAAKLGDELKENVYESLRLLAEGLLKCPDNGLTAEHLEAIRENTFVLIYRILFLFYAEDRGLLPLENRDYRESYSLRGIAKEIAQRLDAGHLFSPTAHSLWGKLAELFRIVNKGDPFLGVPPYNGGLFDPGKHPLLSRWKVGDHYLARAVDQLGRAEAAGRTGRGPVSYRDLDIRHLGSIYEGLLEHRLRLAQEDIAVVKDKDREVFIPVVKLGTKRGLRKYRAGEVYLETDKGERKATGSYYTPDYIVKYIVEHTLGPLVDEKRQKIEEKRQDLQEKVKHAHGYDREAYLRQLEGLDGGLVDEILSIKVLDPAMGSGHFLVEATDFLAKALIEALDGSPKEVEEEEARWACREVVERCIYGVDVNPLAVELAKLSLWISTVAKNRPLSFLDHHLRLGNSLIGSWVKDLGRLPARGKKDKVAQIGEHVIGLFEGKLKERLPVVLGEVMELLRKPSDRVEDIREKEAIYDRILGLLRPFKEVADVWTSTWFGVEVDEGAYETMLLKLADTPAVWEEEIRSQAWFQKAQEEARRRHFFHWELEFPEVFYQETGQRKENPGFDVVLGNPPYANANELNRTLSPFEKPFWKTCFASAKGAYDLYVLFIERSLQIAAQGHLIGLITPNKYLAAPYAVALREHLLGNHILTLLYDVSSVPIFEDSSVYPVVSVIKRGPIKDEDYTVTVEKVHDLSIPPEVYHHHSDLLSRLPDNIWGFLLSDGAALISKIDSISDPLGLVCEVSASTTVSEADEYARVIVERANADSPGLPIINTGLIDRYSSSWGFEPLMHKGNQFTEPFLLLDLNVVSETRASQYRSPKIIFAKVALVIEAVIDPIGEFASLNTNFAFPKDYSLLYIGALCNSRLLSWVYAEYFGALRMSGGYLQFQAPQLQVLPIRRTSFTTPKEERARLVEEGKRLYLEALERLRLGGEAR